MTYRTLVRST
ncbi:hypothetical protein VCHENC02_5572A, partial [Vibrio harveyi]